MANPKHLKILNKGVEAWNEWRKSYSIKPDFENAKLVGAKLSGIVLNAANLEGADLSRAVLSKADISSAGVCGANLTEADLSGANLRNSDFTGARLIEANLSEANLSGASMCGTRLYRAIMIGTDLSFTHFYKADLSVAILRYAQINKTYLSRADLSSADLERLNLRGLFLKGTDFTNANLEGVDLENANLSGSTLVRCNLTNANLTGTILYGTSRDDWIIKDVKCKYIYWDLHGKQRSPRDRDLEPGEFEKLYASLPTIEYIFQNGMTPIDPLIMDRVVQAIRQKQPEFDIKIDSISARGLAPSIKFTVQFEEHKEPALEEVRKGYRAKIAQLEAERDRYYQLISRALDTPKEFKLINAAPGSIVATDGSTVSIEQHIHHALELQNAIAGEPEGSKNFTKVVKKTALDIVGEAMKDIAKGQVKEAAKLIVDLGKDLGPLLVKMAPAAYEFFKGIGT